MLSALLLALGILCTTSASDTNLNLHDKHWRPAVFRGSNRSELHGQIDGLLGLSIRQSGCSSGYGLCENNGACCPLGGDCCTTGQPCCESGYWCYTSEICCSRSDDGCDNAGCCPTNWNCCRGGSCCQPGYYCVVGGCCADGEICSGGGGTITVGSGGGGGESTTTTHTTTEKTTSTQASLTSEKTSTQTDLTSEKTTSTQADLTTGSSEDTSATNSATSTHPSSTGSNTPPPADPGKQNVWVDLDDVQITWSGEWESVTGTCNATTKAKLCQSIQSSGGSSMSYIFTGSSVSLSLASSSVAYQVDINGQSWVYGESDSEPSASNCSYVITYTSIYEVQEISVSLDISGAAFVRRSGDLAELDERSTGPWWLELDNIVIQTASSSNGSSGQPPSSLTGGSVTQAIPYITMITMLPSIFYTLFLLNF